MNVRDLERLLVNLGCEASTLDVITRLLRANDLLPVGGRGPNAPTIGAVEAARIVLAVAGSEVAARSLSALESMAQLYCDNRDFVGTMQALLADPEAAATVKEVRISRNLPLAIIAYDTGEEERFTSLQVDGGLLSEHNRYRSEGVLPGLMLAEIAGGLEEDEASWGHR